ncbi:glycosyltransferase family 39 protein [uncultured Methanobrevibacter sp.]|uniref:glycosyltransferase family 39 protein n=1 Tax=uncultured Methanobrevibacter sp. TaxID=253161 RepID=UPI00263754B8|nr:glycosyltransferase family 39 protein [uncultured Methanobrevibacter sp.]
MNVLIDRSSKEKLGMFLFVLSLLFTLFVTYIGVSRFGIWYDEQYSLTMMFSSVDYIFTEGSTNVHPLGYYFILKFFFKIASILFTNFNVVMLGRLVSVIPLFGILILSITKVKKNFGWLTAGLFAFCLSSMPQLMNFYVEIRMYSWALFFVTVSFVVIYEILNKQSDLKNWIILTIATIASFYTHYFAGIASIGLFLFLFFKLYCENKSELKKWFFSVICVVISYVPWILILLNQIKQVSGYYWITLTTSTNIIGFLEFILSPENTIVPGNFEPSIDFSLYFIVSIIFLGIIMVSIYLNIKNNDGNNRYAMAGLFLVVFVCIIGIICSILIKPMLHPRYLIPALGCFWLGVSILISNNYDNKKIFVLAVIVILIVGTVSTLNFWENESNEYQNSLEVMDVIGQLGDNNVIIYKNLSAYGVNPYYNFDNNKYIWVTAGLDDNLDNLNYEFNNIAHETDVQSRLNNGGHLYYVFKDDGTNVPLKSTDNLEFNKISLENSQNMSFYEVNLK